MYLGTGFSKNIKPPQSEPIRNIILSKSKTNTPIQSCQSQLKRKLIKNNNVFKLKTITATFLQKHIRRLLAFNKFQLYNQYKLKPLFLNHIIKLQSKLRQRKQFKFIKSRYLLFRVLRERDFGARLIQRKFRSIYIINYI